jgi:dTDP-4-dehydrorhamnose reductase
VILVFGAGGQLGRQLVAKARQFAIPLTGVSRAEAEVAVRVAVERAVRATRPAIIVNAAAYNAVDQAESERDAAMRTNVEGPKMIAGAARDAGLPFVHISTDYVFDGAGTRPYTENDEVAPLSVYGLTKAEGEKAVRETLSEHFILRTAWVFGAHGSNTLKTVLKLAAERKELAFVADQTGSPTASADLAEAILLLARTPRDKRQPGTYHVAGSEPATRHALASEIVAAQARYTRRTPLVRAIAAADYPTPARRPAYSALDSSKFAANFGFRPGDWRDGVRVAVAELFSTVGAR